MTIRIVTVGSVYTSGSTRLGTASVFSSMSGRLAIAPVVLTLLLAFASASSYPYGPLCQRCNEYLPCKEERFCKNQKCEKVVAVGETCGSCDICGSGLKYIGGICQGSVVTREPEPANLSSSDGQRGSDRFSCKDGL